MRDTLRAPIVREDDPVRLWRYVSDVAGTFQLPGMWMNADELYALLMAQQVLQRSGDGLFGQALGPLQPRIHALLSERAFRLDRLRVLRTKRARAIRPCFASSRTRCSQRASCASNTVPVPPAVSASAWCRRNG